MTAPPEADLHVQAVLDMLGAGLPAGMVLYDGHVPGTPTMPYIVAYPDPGTTSSVTADGAVADLTLTVQVTAVGSSRREASGAADAARSLLVGQRPTVPGRLCEQIDQSLALPVRRDDKVTAVGDRPTWYAIAQYRFSSVPL